MALSGLATLEEASCHSVLCFYFSFNFTVRLDKILTALLPWVREPGCLKRDVLGEGALSSETTKLSLSPRRLPYNLHFLGTESEFRGCWCTFVRERG